MTRHKITNRVTNKLRWDFQRKVEYTIHVIDIRALVLLEMGLIDDI